MTEKKAKSPEQEQWETDTLIDGTRVDWFLQELVDLVNTITEFEVGITLNVQGSIVSGVAVSGKKYFSLLSMMMEEGGSPGLAKWIASFGEVYEVPAETPEGEEARKPPGYLHLRDAHVFGTYDAPVPSTQGMLWRGRINSISGFSIGQLMRSNGSNGDT